MQHLCKKSLNSPFGKVCMILQQGWNVYLEIWTFIRFVLMVTCSPTSLKIRMISFLTLSNSEPGEFKTTNPSSLYSPMCVLLIIGSSLWSRKRPTSSHDSAPSKQPIVTSKLGPVFWSWLENRKELNEWTKLSIWLLLISVKLPANSIYIYKNWSSDH